MIQKKAITSLILLFHCSVLAFAQSAPRHFIFFSRERENIHNADFYSNPGVEGAQITFPWRKLEPQKDAYDFSEIEEDLLFLQSKSKKLFIQIQDVTFDSSVMAVPAYLLNDTTYHGGQASQYEFADDDDTRPVKAGWVSRRWDIAVRNRFHKLLFKLAEKFDGRIEGINLPESSVEFGNSGRFHPAGFTYAGYRDAIKENMKALKNAFKKSVCVQYCNFMPGDTKENPLLASLYDFASEINVGMGGPDIKVYAPYQMKNSYPLIRAVHGKVITAVAVQDGNYSLINPKTKQRVTINEILDFATDYLRLNYIFWCIEEPYYTKEVLPMLSKMK